MFLYLKFNLNLINEIYQFILSQQVVIYFIIYVLLNIPKKKTFPKVPFPINLNIQ